MAKKEIRRILLHRLGGLGDTLVALPCFRLVRRAFPGAEIIVLTNDPAENLGVGIPSLLDGTGLVDDYLYYPLRMRDPGSLLELRGRIAGAGFDCLVYLSLPEFTLRRTVRDSLFFLSCGLARH